MTNLKFSSDLAECDPLDTSIIIIGQKNFLTELNFSDIKRKLAPRVSEEVDSFPVVQQSFIIFLYMFCFIDQIHVC